MSTSELFSNYSSQDSYSVGNVQHGDGHTDRHSDKDSLEYPYEHTDWHCDEHVDEGK